MASNAGQRRWQWVVLAVAIGTSCGNGLSRAGEPVEEGAPTALAPAPTATTSPGNVGTSPERRSRGVTQGSRPVTEASEGGRWRIRDFFVRRARRDQQPPQTTGTSTSTAGAGAPAPISQPGTPGAPEAAGIVLPAPVGAAAPAPLPTAPPAPTPLLLNNWLHLQDSPVRVFGWIENSFTGNANGIPGNLQNFGVYPNRLADQWMGNQYYLVLENPLESVDTVNFGFRFDMLFGNDWQFTKDYGLFDRAFTNNQFAGLDLPQIYAEVHLPILTPRGLDIRAGRFYSLTGFESPQAIARPLLSVPYSMNFTPFTFFGAYALLHVHDRLNVFSGTIDGFDRWPNEPYKWGYIGGMSWTSRDSKMNLVIGGADADDQLPKFPPANSPYLPVGVPSNFLPGRVNPFYDRSARGYIVGVLTYKWTSRLTQAVETDHVFDPQILGYGRDPYVPHSAAYHGLVNWFLYQITTNPDPNALKVTGVWRSEIFWDPYGLATGNADTYHEITLGLNIQPKPWLWVRPEIRYDWAQFTHPYNDGTRNSQLTMGFDVIFLF